ncbi:alpha-mannosidase [Enterococcus sp. PF1-24]|uniref:alpha-mannosidase n=1 Tax=unclassified Enterococcus TaxID=2608891 RepID=UPI002473E5DC|nr:MULTISPECIES: alpha-mannosidase [unclassified Enterococcus]MDH6365177.1 alpha-mannosidase [Enterococcus sp. PFB1-1]MDH6402239.1 alpha-mannosidase [Enterococcus sp. PF1-24]
MKKKVYIISHSHWDREWYMAYEQHHMRLIELIDDVLELSENDSAFNSFHLDGQTIILDDYLQVRPEKRAALQKAITDGKLKIGPFYILQDDFLISSEANTRNMLIGREESRKWGTPVMLGYFPDTFGNMGQTPQMMKLAGLSAAVFGRGIKPIGFDNQVLATENYTSQFSEMWWQGPDGSEILGLLFANWYNNGNEIPTEKAAALQFWQQKLADVEKFASTNHLLMMNGVDHQPLQKDITATIALANELFPEYEFIHSNFDEYLAAVQADVSENMGTVNGEITSQETDGWYTLANTASARVYLKQWNTKVQRQLENITEPLASIAYEVTGNYPHDQLDYAWKLLMQNHPHDSICGCSLDDVHRGMITRFENANKVGEYLAEEALRQITEQIDTTAFPAKSYPFVVFNTSGSKKTAEATITIELERKNFAEGVPQELFAELEKQTTPAFHVENLQGEIIPAEISEVQVRFDYDLPKDRFRIPYMTRYLTVTLPIADMQALSWESFALVGGARAVESQTLIADGGKSIENEKIKVVIAENGTLTVTDKTVHKSFSDLLSFEDVGDVGNEYIFKQPEGDKAILSATTQAKVEIVKDTPEIAQVKISHELQIPVAADDLLTREQQMVIDFRYRKAGRSQKTAPLKIETLLTVRKNSNKIDFETSLNNQMKDHRLRVLFPTELTVTTHEADSIYEVVRRPNQVSASWENPTNPQHQQAFVNLHEADYGLTVGNYGLNEYEIVNQNTIALTLLRAVGEMGDWGYFSTPEAQCLGEHTFNYSLEIHGAADSRYQTYQDMYANQVPFTTGQLALQEGALPAKKAYLTVEADAFGITALKRRKEDNLLVLRGYNMADEVVEVNLSKEKATPVLLNLLEDELPQKYSKELKPYEIRTIGL